MVNVFHLLDSKPPPPHASQTASIQSLSRSLLHELRSQSQDAVRAIQSTETMCSIWDNNMQTVRQKFCDRIAVCRWCNRIPLTGENQHGSIAVCRLTVIFGDHCAGPECAGLSLLLQAIVAEKSIGRESFPFAR